MKMSWKEIIAISGIGALSSAYKMLVIPVLLLVSCNVIDYITALTACKMQGKKWDSNTGIKGIVKKVLMWLLVIVGVMFDELLLYASHAIGISLPFNFFIGCVVACWLICNEMISILENIKTCGVSLPPFLEPLIKTTQEKIEQKTEDGKNEQ